MAVGWTFALTMALLPLLGISDYRKFAVCLPFEIEDSNWSLAYVVFLILINGVAFFVLMGCYLRMYCAIRGSQAWNSNDSRIAKRMALLVFTDFLCWAPIAFFSLTAVSGLHLISLEQAKVFTIFVLPLNSCANPFLYAIFTKQFKKDCVLLCKRIEESRVTRGIGRCRHSSNFSNRHTPANTNSAVEKRSGSGTHSDHLAPVVCQCGIGLASPLPGKVPLEERLLISTPSPVLAATAAAEPPPVRTINTRFREMATKWFRRKKDTVRFDSSDSTSCPSSQLAAGELAKRASSISSDNFSSRSDSWRQGNIPLRLLDTAPQPPVPAAAKTSTARRSSWAAAAVKQHSHDSSMSSSRHDSSTASNTFRTASTTRSSVSSSGSSAKPTSFTDTTSAGSSSAGLSGQHRSSRVLGKNLPTAVLNGDSKPSIIRQDAILARSAAYTSSRTRSANGGRGFICPDCVRKEIGARDAQYSKASKSRVDLEQKLHQFFNKLTESSQEENSEVSSKDDHPGAVSTDQSTGDSNKENLSLSRDTNDTSLDNSVSSHGARLSAATSAATNQPQQQPVIEILPHSPFAASLPLDEQAPAEARESNFLFADSDALDTSRTPSSLSVRTQIANPLDASTLEPSKSADDINKCHSLTSIGSERGATGNEPCLSKRRRVAGSDNSLKMSLKNFPAILRSFSSQSTHFLQKQGRRTSKQTSPHKALQRGGGGGHYSAGDMRLGGVLPTSRSSDAIRDSSQRAEARDLLLMPIETDQSDLDSDR